MQLHTGSDSFVHKVCFLRHRGILMPCTELAGCAFVAACSLAQGCEKLHTPHCFAHMAWVADNYGWLMMEGGARVPSFSADNRMPGWVGAILELLGAGRRLSTILCIGSSSCLSEAGMRGLRVAWLQAAGCKGPNFFSLVSGSLRIKGLSCSWHRLLPCVVCTRRRKLVFGIRENRETGRHVDF